MKVTVRFVILFSGLCLALGCSDSDDNKGNTGDGAAVTKKDGGGSSTTTKGPFCLRTCTKNDDCCKTPPCDTGASRTICSKGYCKYLGCKTNADCVVNGKSAGTCATMKNGTYTIGICGLWCTKDSECKTPLKCVMPVKAVNKKICGMACKEDKDCLTAVLECVDKTYCNAANLPPDKCTKDAHCPTLSGQGKCDVKSGQCVCETDKKCQDALKAGGGTYKCVNYPY